MAFHMHRCLIIGTENFDTSAWQVALKAAGLPLEFIFPNDEGCQTLFNQEVSLVIYRLSDNHQTAALINCLETNSQGAPVILTGKSPSTRIFQQYEYLGVKDIFAQEDFDRLVLIVRRELQNLQLKYDRDNLRELYYESEERHRALIDKAEDAIAFIQDGMHLHVNRAYYNTFGYIEAEELENITLQELIATPYQEDFKQFFQKTQSDAQQQIELDCQRIDGTTFRAILQFSPAIYEGETCIMLQLQNLEFEHKARLISDQDPETGLNNRHRFMRDLNHLIAQKDPESKSVSLLYLMVDGFDEIKYNHGLISSESIMREIAQILQQQIKSNMVPYRYGDHSFTIIIQTDNSQLARVAAETLIRLISLHQYLTITDMLPPTLSIGISSLDKNQQETPDKIANQLLEEAYLACREIYDNAGNGFITWSSLAKMQEKKAAIKSIDDTTHLKELIEHAIEHDRFRLLFQPMVSIRGHTGEFYSVLLRMLDHEGQEIRPRYFIRHALSHNLMKKIDQWVVKNAIEELAMQRHLNHRTIFYLHLSESAIADDTMLLWVVDCLRQANAKGSWLVFQFNYNDIKNQLGAAEKLINGLQKINCGIAMSNYDDSVGARKLLQKLPVNSITLSKELSNEILANPQNSSHLQSLDQLNRQRNIQTIINRIENPDDISLLWQAGIHFVIGTFVYEPTRQIA